MKRVTSFLIMLLFLWAGSSWGQTYLTESFEGAWSGTPAAPSGWSITHTTSTGTGSGTDPMYWVQNIWSGTAWSILPYGGVPTNPAGAYDLTSVAWFNDGNAKALQKDQLSTGNVDLSASTSPRVSFYLALSASSALTLKVRGSADGGVTWADIQTLTKPGVSWTKMAVSIPAIYKTSTARIGFEVTASWGSYDIFIDKVVIQETPAPIAITSTAIGGLWSSPATWVGGVVPDIDANPVIAAGSTVVLDMSANVGNLTVDGKLQWLTTTVPSGTVNTLQAQNITISSTGMLLAHGAVANGSTVKVTGNFTNNGIANFGAPSAALYFIGTSGTQTLGGSGTFIADNLGRGMIRQLFFSSLAACDISVTLPQSFVTGNLVITAGSLNTNGKLSIDNTAISFGGLINRSIYTVTVNNMGTGYTSAPDVTFTAAPAGGTTATGVCNFDASTGTVRSITITNAGDGYRVAPTLTFVGGGGTGLAAVAALYQNLSTSVIGQSQKSAIATITGGININSSQGVGSIFVTDGGLGYSSAPTVGFALPVSFINLVTNGGSGYTSAPTVTFSGGGGATQATGTAVVCQGKVVSVHITAGGTGYTSVPTITLTGGGGTGATAEVPVGMLPTATASIDATFGMVNGFTITNPGYGYLLTFPAVTLTGGGFTTAAAGATSRHGVYNLIYNWFLPAATNGIHNESAVIPANRRIHALTMAGGAGFGAAFTGDITLYGLAPLPTFTGDINMGGNMLTFEHPSYVGTTGTATAFVSNGKITYKLLGSTATQTRPFPFNSYDGISGFGNNLLSMGSATTVLTEGSTITQVTGSYVGAPSGTNMIGSRTFRLQTYTGLYGLSPTLRLTWNSIDALAADASYLTIAQATSAAGAWTIRSIPSGTGAINPAGGNRTTAISGVGPIVTTGDDYFGWNYVAPACPLPTAGTTTNITTTTAVLNWTNGGSETLWNVKYGAPGFDPLTAGTLISGITAHPYTLNPPLTSGTAYAWYVQADCGGGLTSNWSGPFLFTTVCDPISSLPWNESFESVTIPALPGCWFKENGDYVTTNNANSTYDADARTGAQFLRESWSATNEYVWTPGFVLTAGTSYDFSFWWAGDTYAGWTGDVFYNTVQISTSATQLGASFVLPATTTTKTYAQVSNSFIPATTGTYYFAIRVNATATPWYLSFDDFKLMPTPLTAFFTFNPEILDLGYGPSGGYSTEKTYTVAGTNLNGTDGNILVTAPANFEVSLTTGTGFGQTVNIAYTGSTLAATTVFVRCAPTAPNATYSGNITHAGGGASGNVAVTGNSSIFSAYCPSGASNTADEEIFSVTVNGVNNALNCTTVAPGPGSILNRYSNFYPLGPIFTLNQGAAVPFIVEENECDGATFYAFGTAIWVDFNQDGDFLDAGEQAFVETAVLIGPRNVTGFINVPADAVLGVTAMRVTVVEGSAGAALTPCLAYSYGETEDYKVQINPGEFGSLAGYVYKFGTTTPISGATVSFLTYSATTDGTGYYNFPSVAAGTYSLTASAPDYASQTVNNVAVVLNTTTTQDFALGYATITVTPTSLTQTLPPNGLATKTLTISNASGNQPLYWNASIELLTDQFVKNQLPTLPAGFTPSSNNPDQADIAENNGSINTNSYQQNSVNAINPAKYVNSDATRGLLWDNGPMITHPTGGFGGAPASALQSVTGPMLTTYGVGIQQTAGNSIADDFVVTENWALNTIKVYTYQTGSTTTSTITGIYVQIWNGAPNAGGVVVWGNLTTNRLASTTWSGIYRSIESSLLDNNRPIMEVVANVSGCNLTPGTYWVQYQLTGTLASGPWGPPISIWNQGTTGNALQLTSTGWAAFVSGTAPNIYAQGMPFVIEGVASTGWVSLGTYSGVINPGASQVVNVNFDATGLIDDDYFANINITHNGQPVTDGVLTVPVKLTVASTVLPGLATNPNPANNAIDVSFQPELSWTSGVGTSRTQVLIYKGAFPLQQLIHTSAFFIGNTYDLADPLHTVTLLPKQVYTWQVNERNAAGIVTGTTWKFTTIGAGTIAGLVTDAYTTLPLDGVTITIGDGAYTGTTAGGGYYSIAGVVVGTYNVTADFAGYNSQTQSATVVHAQTALVNFALNQYVEPPSNLQASVSNNVDVNLTWVAPGAVAIPDTLIYEPFEDYTAGGYVAQQANAMGRAYWTTWSNLPGSAEDATVSNAFAHGGTKSLLCSGTNDAVMLFGNKTTGNYGVNFYMYIPSGKVGYYNILQDFAGGSSIWGLEIFFNPGGVGKITANGITDVATFTYGYDQWFYMENLIDLDADQATVKCNGVEAYSWQWSVGTTIGTGVNKLSAIDIYAAPTYGTPYFYIDDIDFSKYVYADNITSTLQGFNVYRNGEFLDYTTEHMYNDLDLAGGTYDYTLTAVYAEGESEPIGPATVAVLPAPLLLSADADFYGVDLVWEDGTNYPPADNAFYNVFRDGVDIADVYSGMTYRDEAVSNGSTYCYKVSQVPAPGLETAQSNELCATVPQIPVIVVDPLSLTETHYTPPAQVTTQVVTVTNDGLGTLDWTLAVNSGAKSNQTAPVVNQVIPDSPEDIQRLADRLAEDNMAARTSSTPVLNSEPMKIDYVAAPTDAVLWTQMTPSTDGVSASQDFEAGMEAYDCRGADDFTVTGGPWAVNVVSFIGAYWNATPGGPALGFNIEFFNNAAGVPGTSVQNYLSLPYTAVASGTGYIFTVNLPATLNLANGNYWIAIQARMDFATGGQFGLQPQNIPQIQNEKMWICPGGGFPGALTWTAGSVMWPTQIGKDWCFQLESSTVVPTYCTATSGSQDEYIGNVLCGSINNTSTWQGGVANYTAISTTIADGGSQAITVSNGGNIYGSDKVTCWVDWNNDFTFGVASNEEFVLLNVGGTGATFTGAIAVPAGTPAGDYRMRVRMTYSTAPVPCGASSYGEVEDYTITVSSPWLSADILSGSLAPGASTGVTVTFKSEGLTFGTHTGSLVFSSNDPVNPVVTVPAELNVVSVLGTITGTVTDALAKGPVSGVVITADELRGYSTTTGVDGTYTLDVMPGAYTLTAEKAGYITESVTIASILSGETITQDFMLEFAAPVLLYANGGVGQITLGWTGNAAAKASNLDHSYSNVMPVVKKDSPAGVYDPSQYPDMTRQGGDNVASATVIGALPYSNTGTTSGYLNDYDETCPFSGGTAPDVVYSYTPATSGCVSIDLCGSSYDTKVYVYENAVTLGNPFACNDDYYVSGDPCGSFVSALFGLALTGGNTYYFVVDGYGINNGNYIINVTSCAPSCVVECPAGAIDEDEACGEDLNGGCNAAVPAYTPISNGDVVCGTAWADANSRDTDWYELIIDAPKTITWSVTAEFPVYAFIIEGNFGCDGSYIMAQGQALPCSTAVATATVPPGKYWLWVGNQTFAGSPCGAGNDYVAELTCEDAFLTYFNVQRDGENIVTTYYDTYVDTDVLADVEYCYTVNQVIETGFTTGESNELCATILCGTGCDYTLNFTDSWGDGWNGAYVSIYQGNNLIGDFTLASGLAGAQTVTLCNATATSLVWSEGSYDEECGFELLDSFGNLLTSFEAEGSPVAGEFFSFITDCSAPSQDILLPQGWSGWSSFIAPAAKATFEGIVAPVAADMIISQYFGNLYWPAYGINTMGDFSNAHGYVTKMSAQASLTITGDYASTTVAVNAGWNIFPVLSTCNVDAAELLNIDGFVIAVEIAGNGVYYPAYNINTLLELVPGKAYYVKTTAAGTYTFPACVANKGYSYNKPVRSENITNWNDVSYTGVSHTIIFSESTSSLLVNGDVIGAFTNGGLCAGMTIVNGTTTAMSLFADDISTNDVDGFAEGEMLNFRVMRPSTSEEFILAVTYNAQSPNFDGLFAVSGLSVIDNFTMSITGINNPSLSGLSIYPNPSTGIFNISINGMDNNIDYVIMNAQGQQVVEGKLLNSQEIDLTSQPKGVYFIKFTGNSVLRIEKVVVK
jgi:hypothetical protein